MRDRLRLWVNHQHARLRGFLIGLAETPPNCLRCNAAVSTQRSTFAEVQLPRSSNDPVRLRLTDCYPGLRNYECPVCFWRYSQRDGYGLVDRWLMPITLPLYAFEFRPLLEGSAEKIAQEFRRNEGPANLKLMCQEIARELDHPTQQLREIHGSRHAESELRDFLRRFVAEVQSKLRSSEASS